jgi:uncharacterized protein YqeY
MSLVQNIDGQIKEAMKSKNASRLRGLREIKSQLLLAQTDGSGLAMDEEREIKILQKMLKQRRDSHEIYIKQSRQDLADKEQEEIDVIAEFLPKPLSTEELTAYIQKLITENNASSMADLGKIMGLASKELGGKAEGKQISEIAKGLLK